MTSTSRRFPRNGPIVNVFTHKTTTSQHSSPLEIRNTTRRINLLRVFWRTLVKVFREEKHACAFMDGKLFANKLSYFKKIDGSDIRRDEDEGVVMLTPKGAVLELTATDQTTGEVSSIRISESDLAGPITMRPKWTDHINLFCMYAGHGENFTQLTDRNVHDFGRWLAIPKGVLEKFGKHAVVITNVREFFERITVGAQQKRYRIWSGLVRYYDADVGTSPKSEIDTIFAKRDIYAREREYRIAIDTGDMGCNAITLCIGSIDDIAMRLHTAEVDVKLAHPHISPDVDAELH